jgi:hypothetical protein
VADNNNNKEKRKRVNQKRWILSIDLVIVEDNFEIKLYII